MPAVSCPELAVLSSLVLLDEIVVRLLYLINPPIMLDVAEVPTRNTDCLEEALELCGVFFPRSFHYALRS